MNKADYIANLQQADSTLKTAKDRYLAEATRWCYDKGIEVMGLSEAQVILLYLSDEEENHFMG